MSLRERIRLRTRARDAWNTVERRGKILAGETAARALSTWDTRSPRASNAVAIGFAGWKPGLGGVRNHLNSIKRHSTHSIRVLPGDAASQLVKRAAYLRQLVPRMEQDRLSKFPVVHSHVDPDFIRGCARARAGGSRWAHTYHSLYVEEAWGPLSPFQVEINRALIEDARDADMRISVSPWLRSFLRESHGIETICIPNGVDVSLCDRARPERFVNRTGLSGFVVFVGSLNEVKNPRLFIDLAAVFPEIQFVMIGKDLTLASLEPWYGRRLPGNLHPIGPLGHLPTLDAIAASTAMVMPSNFEGLPTALMEAMALGKAVVASDAFGCRDAVGDDSCGVLFEPRSLDAARAALDEALTRSDIGANAARRAREQFDWRVLIPRIDCIYSDLFVAAKND